MKAHSLMPGRLLAFRALLADGGWRMAALGFVCVSLSYGAVTGGLPIIYGDVMDEFGWSHTTGVLVFSFKNIASAFVSMAVAGPLIERFGLKAVFAGACFVLAAGMLSFLWIDGVWGYYLAGFSLGAGVMPTMIVCQTLVSRWFNAKQGLAVGIVATGISAGGVVYPLIVASFADAFGWRIAFASLSIGVIVIAMPLFLLFAGSAEKDASSRSGAPIAAKAEAAPPDAFAAVTRTPTFWIAATGLMLTSAADSAVLQHTFLFLERDRGIDGQLAAAAMSIIFGAGIIAKAAAGRTFDLYSLRGMAFGYFLVAVSIALVFSIGAAALVVLFALVRGVAHGGFVIIPAVMAKHCYGPRLLNRTLPFFMGAFATGNAAGPPVLSYLYDSTGGYGAGFILCIIVCIVSAFFLLSITSIFRPRLAAPGARDLAACNR